MKLTCWILSILLHAGVAAAAAFLATPGTLNVDLGVPVYEVDLVRVEPAKKGAPKAPKKPVPKKAAPKKPAPEKPEPEKPALKKPEPVAEAPKKPEPEPKPAPAPAPEPKPEAKKISAKKEQPKPEPKPAPVEKKKPAPKKPAKPEKTREQLLAEALRHAEKDVNWLEHLEDKAEDKEREALQKEIAALRESVAEQEAEEEAAAEEEGAGGDAEEGSGSAGLLDVYRVVVRDTIKENWRYPDISASGELSARVEMELAPDGSIVDYRLIESSGRPDFDTSTLAAIQATEQLPPPPRSDIKLLRITFNLQDMLQ
jgi:colicin import membrane protein